MLFNAGRGSSFSLDATRMTILRLSLLLSILLLPSSFVLATSNYEYGPDEYVTVASGISSDGKYAITAHGSSYLGYDNFNLYLTDAASGKNIGPLEEVVETLCEISSASLPMQSTALAFAPARSGF
jgi:hypothetical protein